ncbi:MAG TPA: Gfo/Idh/MocA family oxidoreductase [bacterium]|nr:Gfo/Idh/MocA family oxidoreductase [bacterium]
MSLRWGVLGAARILRKVVPALRAAGGRVVVIGASGPERARAAAAEWDIPHAADDYQSVLDDPQVDAIYLPLANSLHHPWLLAAAAAGKHCLCEKPLTVTAAEAREARDAFGRAGRRLMEAFMWCHHPQAARVRELMRPGELGEPRRFHATFSFPLDRPDDYRWKRAMGGGALLDIGCYGVSAARYFLGAEPAAVSARGIFRPGPDGVDESAAAWLDFGEGRVATVSCSFASAFSQGLEVTGSEGRARLDRPWLSADVPVRIDIERGFERRTEEVAPADAYRLMAEHFGRLAADPRLPAAPGEDGTAQADVLGALLASARAGGAVIDLPRTGTRPPAPGE